MLRNLFRRSRTVRVPIDTHQFGVQTVNVSKPRTSYLSRCILVGATTYLTIQVMRNLDPLGNYQNRDVFQEQLDNARTDSSLLRKKIPRREGTAEASDTISQDPAWLRLTIPIWIRKDRPRPYDYWEPEYKEYARLQADGKRVEKLKREVFEVTMKSIKDAPMDNPEFKVIGFNGAVTASLDIIPQLFAPPVYKVPCVWISLNQPGFRFDWRELEQDNGAKIERVFRPLVLLDASKYAAKTFLYVMYLVSRRSITNAFDTNHVDNYKDDTLYPSPKQQSKPSAHNDSSQAGRALTTPTKSAFPSWPDVRDSEATRELHQDVLSAVPFTAAISQAAIAFNRMRNVRQKAAVATNTRGICQVKGIITFHGTRGKFKMELVAHYLPSENVFVGSVQVRQRYIVQDFNAMQKFKETRDRKRAEEAAKKAVKIQSEQDSGKESAKTVSMGSEGSSTTTPTTPTPHNDKDNND